MRLNATKKKKLSSKQRKGIAALMACPTVLEAAELVGVHRATMFRWLDDPSFRSELHKAEGRILDNAVRRLLSLADISLDCLEAILDDPQQATSQRRMAAQAVLDQLVRLRTLRAIDDRLTRLEERVLGSKV